MTWVDDWGLSLATFLPIVGAIVVLFVPQAKDKAIKTVGTLFAGLALLAGILVLFRFDYGNAGAIQLEVDSRWIPQIGSRYHVGVSAGDCPLEHLRAAASRWAGSGASTVTAGFLG